MAEQLGKCRDIYGNVEVFSVITGSGGFSLAKKLEIPFVQEVIAVSAALGKTTPQTISGLACGKPIHRYVAFLGGPLHFLTELRKFSRSKRQKNYN